jgi:membrane-associated phospholipid phosphatase
VNRRIAEVLSVALQPLTVPTLITAILFYITPEATNVPKSAKWSLLLLVMLTTFLVPVISMVGMKMTSSISSFKMPDKKERIMPFSIISSFYLMTALFFHHKLNVDYLLVGTMAIIALCVIVLTIITVFWKISAHITGLAGMLAMIVVLAIKFDFNTLIYPMIVTIMACGAVGTARLSLDAHKPSEIYGGFVFGFAFCFIAYYYVLLI